jgi:antitoxin VapB
MAGVGITDAIVMAMKEAIERRRADETPLETAARLRLKHRIQLKGTMREPLQRDVFDEIWKDN